MAKPGIMLYFDVLEPIRALPDREKGRLLTAMLEYGQTGKAPEFTGRLALAWGFVKPRIDRDEEEYNRIALKKQYANYCKEQKKKGEPEMGFEEWSATGRNDHVEPRGTTRNPTTATTTITKTNTNSSTAASTAAAATTCTAAAADSTVKVMGGTLGKNVVFLSEAQIADLLERMDLQSFDHYVDKLSEFILRNDARVKNHYETILRWYEQDGLVRGGR